MKRKTKPMIKWKTKIKGGAMTYAIIFTMLTGVFALTFLLITSNSRFLEVQFGNKEKVLMNIYSTAEFALNSNQSFSKEEKLLFVNNDTCYVKKKQWGLFNIYHFRALKNKFQLKRTLMTLGGVAQSEIPKDAPTLYIIDNDQALKLTGETKLKGNLYVPKRGIGRAYIEGTTFSGEELYVGEKHISNKKLPELHEYFGQLDIDRWIDNNDAKLLEKLPPDSIFSFAEDISLYETVNPIFIEEQRLVGNLIIHSYDSIFVSRDAVLDNVILISPTVHFEEGFDGSVQVFADERIILEDNVNLHYPTVLWLQDRDEGFHREREALIEIGEFSTVLGTIIMTSKSRDFRKPEKLLMLKHSTFVGNIYNQGETELKGTIWGILYTKNFHLETKNATYTNHLVDVEIDGTALPDFFVLPLFFEAPKDQNKQIKWLE